MKPENIATIQWYQQRVYELEQRLAEREDASCTGDNCDCNDTSGYCDSCIVAGCGDDFCDCDCHQIDPCEDGCDCGGDCEVEVANGEGFGPAPLEYFSGVADVTALDGNGKKETLYWRYDPFRIPHYEQNSTGWNDVSQPTTIDEVKSLKSEPHDFEIFNNTGHHVPVSVHGSSPMIIELGEIVLPPVPHQLDGIDVDRLVSFLAEVTYELEWWNKYTIRFADSTPRDEARTAGSRSSMLAHRGRELLEAIK